MPTSSAETGRRRRPFEAEPNRPVLVGQAMVSQPKLCDESATVGEVRQLLLDSHVHAALVTRAGRLIAVIERSDLGAHLPGTASVKGLGRLGDRVVGADERLAPTLLRMRQRKQRRLAVTDADGTLVGLLCLKGTLMGFCSDEDVRDRMMDPH